MRIDESKLREWTPGVRIDFGSLQAELRIVPSFRGVGFGTMSNANSPNPESALKQNIESLPFKKRFLA